MSSRGFSKRLETKAIPSPHIREDARTKIGNFVYIAADTHTSWKKVYVHGHHTT